jgi:hypothetical protein
MLDLAEVIGKGAVEIDTGVPNPDHGAVVVFDGLHVNALVLGAVDGAVEKVPQYEGQQVFVGTQFEIAVDLVDDNCFSAYGSRQETSH